LRSIGGCSNGTSLFVTHRRIWLATLLRYEISDFDSVLVIADTTPLRYLTVIGQIGLLPTIFKQVVIPPVVWDELTAASTSDNVRSFFESRPDWLQLRSPRMDSMEIVSRDLHEGERAALALAIEIRADLVLIDEAAGRHEAKQLGIRITGTVGVLTLAAERGLVNVPDVLSRLRLSGFYIDENVLRSAFEPWL
jgi:predicted nucleic acid-binding protein